MDNNLDYKDLDKIKKLIIDILSPPLVAFNNKIFEIFFTLLSFIKKAKKMTTNVTNKLSGYFFFIIGNILLNYINFANISSEIINKIYIAINQYLPDKFYKIMINTNLF